jgi:NADH:ubiquinone oxidoreductase subunit 4 (subunit M)
MSSADSIFIQIWKENKKMKISTKAFILTFVAALMMTIPCMAQDVELPLKP